MAGFGCGSHKHYQSGCLECQRLGLAYKRKRRAAIADGTWQHPVSAGVVLNHINMLRNFGMTVVGIARLAHLSDGTVQAIVNNSPKTVTGPIAAAILGIEPQRTDRAGQVSAVGVTRRIRAMVASGHSLTFIAQRLNKNLAQVWTLAWERRTSVSDDTYAQVVNLFDELLLIPGTSARARNAAKRNGWMPPEAWRNIDDPDATPCDNTDDVFVDQVRVDKALAGEPVSLTTLERHHAVHVGLALGLSLSLISDRIHVSHTTAQSLAGKPLPAGYELVA